MKMSEPAANPRLDLPDMVGVCMYKQLLYDNHNTFSSVAEFFVLMALIICGLRANYSLWKKLMEEKKKTPIGRKGNVIEPIVSWYCIIQSVYWPCFMFICWIFRNQVVTLESPPSWVVYIIWWQMMAAREYIAFNSLCCATIRYWYIVHQERAKQWDYERTRRKFQLLSVLFPLIHQILATFPQTYDFVTTGNDKFEACMTSYDDIYLGTNSSEKLPRVPFLHLLTTSVIPEPLMQITNIILLSVALIVFSNSIDAYLYFRIFKNVKG